MDSVVQGSAPNRPIDSPIARDIAHVAWLPHRGLGNGIDADAWAPVVEVTGPAALRLLDALAVAGVAAFASPIGPGREDVWRMWVATRRYSTAEQVMLREMPAILTEHPDALC
jgi:hypothetical protein